jgi:hypothetical protein
MADLLRGGLANTLPDDVLAELKATAQQLCAPGKGFLASDESAGPWLRAGKTASRGSKHAWFKAPIRTHA